jgi:type II secretory pathway pseudopilin PulG
MITRAHPPGFALVELLVAMTLTAIIGTLLLSMLRTTTAQVDRLTREDEITHAVHSTLTQLRQDMQTIYWSIRDPRTGLTGTTRTINGHRLDTLSYVTLRLPWEGTDPSDARPMAVRIEPTNDRLNAIVQDYAGGRQTLHPLPDTLVPYLQEFRLQYHNGEHWQDTWDTTVQQRLPTAIAVRLMAQYPGGPPHIVQTIFVPSRSPTLHASG